MRLRKAYQRIEGSLAQRVSANRPLVVHRLTLAGGFACMARYCHSQWVLCSTADIIATMISGCCHGSDYCLATVVKYS